LPAENFEQRPARMRLQRLSQTHRVYYQSAAATRTTIDEGEHTLWVRGAVEDSAACAHALRAWLRATARRTMTPWLVAHERGTEPAGCQDDNPPSTPSLNQLLRARGHQSNLQAPIRAAGAGALPFCPRAVSCQASQSLRPLLGARSAQAARLPSPKVRIARRLAVRASLGRRLSESALASKPIDKAHAA
jgi:hypothetical protein